MNKEIEIPEGYTARIEGNKVILEQNDESIRNFLYEFIKVCGWSEKQFPPKEKVLAYLERQKEQNPAEWSEEDKMHLNNAILAAEKEWGAESRTAKFLKSLRPHWKPSEEQPMPDSTQLIAEWEKEKAVLEQKDFRGDAERMAYNAFLDGFVKGIGYGRTK